MSVEYTLYEIRVASTANARYLVSSIRNFYVDYTILHIECTIDQTNWPKLLYVYEWNESKMTLVLLSVSVWRLYASYRNFLFICFVFTLLNGIQLRVNLMLVMRECICKQNNLHFYEITYCSWENISCLFRLIYMQFLVGAHMETAAKWSGWVGDGNVVAVFIKFSKFIKYK